MAIMRLEGKVAIVTGAASGIGKAIAETYAAAGANVVVADLNITNANTVAENIAKSSGHKAIGIAMDVAKEDMVETGIAQVIKTFGHVDVLVSNAGIQTISPIVDFTFEAWKHLIDIHVHGAFLTARACMREMIKSKKGGSIILMGSIHSVEASYDKAAYVTAKHALLGFARAISKEGAKHNIRANLIGPGFVRTPLVDKQIPEQAKSLGITPEEVVKNVMLGETVDGEFTTVEDIAAIALFLASFNTNALTGQSVLATHGWHMN